MSNLAGQFRQKKEDRRKCNKIDQAPFTDCDGVIVRADRRMQPDRRVFNLGADKGVSEHIEF